MSRSVTAAWRLTGWARAVIRSSDVAAEVVKSFMLWFGKAQGIID